MNSIKFEDFANNIIILLEETFENPQGYYLDRSSGGLLGTLQKITADQASRSFKPGMTSIAAHVEHTRFYLSEVVVTSLRGDEVGKLDWNQSWVLKTVNELEWQELKQMLHETCSNVLELVKARETWDDQPITDAMVGLAHTAYHVGAIRQMVLMLEP
jgi:DinB superfamily